MISPGFEPGTACVLDRSDNQLHHETVVSWLFASKQVIINCVHFSEAAPFEFMCAWVRQLNYLWVVAS